MRSVYLISLAVLLNLAGCSSNPDSADIALEQLKAESIIADAKQEKAEESLSTIPDWLILPPKNDDTGVYGVGIGESQKLDLAIKKAGLNAQYELAKSFSQVLSGNEKNYQREGSEQLTEQYTKVVDSLVVSVPLNGYETVQQKVHVIDGKFVAYKLIRLTYKRLAQSLKENQYGVHQEEIKAAFTELEKRLGQETKK